MKARQGLELLNIGYLSIFSCAAFRKNLFFVYLTMLRNLNLFRITLSRMFSYFLPAVM